ncbi:hypothetical protein Tco_0430159 [Tanacetum coccineum]
MTQTCGHITNSYHLDTHHHHVVAAVDGTVVGTASNTDHTEAEHKQVGCRLPAVEHYKPQPCAQTLHGTCPSDMTVCTPSSLSSPDVSLYDPSYHISLA